MPTDTDLENLSSVNQELAEKLKERGFESFQSIAVSSIPELTGTTNIGDSTAADIIQAARDAAEVGGFETGAAVLERRQEIGKLSWQISEVDNLLGGGIETQSVTEVYGEAGSGKSQVTHQMAVNVQLSKEHGGLEGGCVFVDSEDGFRPERIEDMVRGLDNEILADEIERRDIEGAPDNEETLEELVEAFLDQIHVAKAFNSNHQILLTEKAKELASEHEESEWPIRIICVDSLTTHFRAEYVGQSELADRQQKLNKHLHDLMRIGDLFNTAILVTNQVRSNSDSNSGDPTQAIEGNILGHASTFRIYLRKLKGDKRIVRLVDAPNLANGEALMRIEEDGLKTTSENIDELERSQNVNEGDTNNHNQRSTNKKYKDNLQEIHNHIDYYSILYAFGEIGKKNSLQEIERLIEVKPAGRNLSNDLDFIQIQVQEGKISEEIANHFAEELCRLKIQEVQNKSSIKKFDSDGVREALKEMILEPV
jgi:DNA repair protein RadA